MAFKYYKTFEHDSIASGSTVSGSWTADEDLVIKRVHVVRKDGTALTASTIYFKIADRVFTRELAPAVVFGKTCDISAELNIPFSKGEKLDYTFKNLEGATISVFIYFEVHTA
jgi:hypothetical protein